MPLLDCNSKNWGKIFVWMWVVVMNVNIFIEHSFFSSFLNKIYAIIYPCPGIHPPSIVAEQSQQFIALLLAPTNTFSEESAPQESIWLVKRLWSCKCSWNRDLAYLECLRPVVCRKKISFSFEFHLFAFCWSCKYSWFLSYYYPADMAWLSQ